MLDRKINDVLLSWKTKTNHNPIIIKGCRQCGKTFSVKYFCEQNYKNVIYLNFLQNPEFSSIFNGSLEVDIGCLQFLTLNNLKIFLINLNL